MRKIQIKCETCKVYFDEEDLQRIQIFVMDSDYSDYRYYCPQHKTKAKFGVRERNVWGTLDEPTFYTTIVKKIHIP